MKELALNFIQTIFADNDPHNPIDFVELNNGLTLGINHECICFYRTKDMKKDDYEPVNCVDYPDDAKLFMCYWDVDFYINADETKIVEENFFTEEIGYSYDSIQAIENLNVGECHTLDYKSHFVTRIR